MLGSSSKGNAYILSAPTGCLLIEVGIPYRKLQQGLNFDFSNIIGALGTHSHLDHMCSAKDVLNNGIDLFVTSETANTLGLSGHRLNIIEPLKQFAIGNFIILGFPTEHDCLGSIGYLIQYVPTGEKLIFLTDSYYSKYRFKGLNYIMIEANYIKDTLDSNVACGYISEEGKRRLLQSHFSLDNVKKFLQANDLSQVKEIILLHLSDRNADSKRMVKEIFELTGIEPKIADPDLEIELKLYPY